MSAQRTKVSPVVGEPLDQHGVFRRRTALGLTRRDLAQAARVDEQTVNNLETRQSKRRPSSLAAVLAALDKAETDRGATVTDDVSEVRLEPDGTLIVRGSPPPDTIATVEQLRRLRDRDRSSERPI